MRCFFFFCANQVADLLETIFIATVIKNIGYNELMIPMLLLCNGVPLYIYGVVWPMHQLYVFLPASASTELPELS